MLNNPANYVKFFVAALWAVAEFVLVAYGVDLSELVNAVLSAAVALGVVALPNVPKSPPVE